MSYDPTIGRFISEDPIAFDSGDTNLYRYVGNSPTDFTDPFGLQGIKTGYAPQRWPVRTAPWNTIVFIGPPHPNDPNDSFKYKIEYLKSIGVPDKNVFTYNGTDEIIAS